MVGLRLRLRLRVEDRVRLRVEVRLRLRVGPRVGPRCQALGEVTRYPWERVIVGTLATVGLGLGCLGSGLALGLGSALGLGLWLSLLAAVHASVYGLGADVRVPRLPGTWLPVPSWVTVRVRGRRRGRRRRRLLRVRLTLGLALGLRCGLWCGLRRRLHLKLGRQSNAVETVHS